MPTRLKGRTSLGGSRLVEGADVTPNSAVTITMNKMQRPPKVIELTLTDVVVSLSAANDYGSVKLCDLPNKALRIMAAQVALTGVVAGMASNVGTAVTAAVGTIATTTTNFATAGEKSIVPTITGTGGGTTATLAGASTSTEASATIAAGASNAIYLNLADAVTSGTGTITLNGTVRLTILDVDSLPG